MNLKRKKKGFTIVELVIVLAVIGILAAILIPTFVNVVNKANEAKDKSLVYNLNEAIILEQIDHNGKYDTMHDTLVAMDKKQGFGIDRIRVKSKDSEILWDSVNNRFVLVTTGKNDSKTYYNGTDEINYPVLKGEHKIYEVDLWRITDTFDANSPYSTYYTGTETSVTTSKGFDAGNTNVDVKYDNSENQTVVIRTNGGDLTVDDSSTGTIYHYGEAETVEIIECHTSSYHENGTVQFLEVAAGHIVLEEEADVTAFHFTATGEGADAKFENAEGKKISVDISKVPEEKLPDFSRDSVTIAENGTYVAEVKTDTTEYIWLFGQGIKEQMVVTNTTATIAENGVLKEGVEVGAEDGSVAEQIANPAKRNDAGALVDENNVVIDLTDVDFSKADALKNVDVQIDPVASKEDVQIGATLFAGGTGTEKNPYLISDSTQLLRIDEDEHEGRTYYKFINNIDLNASRWYVTILYDADIDLNNYTLNLTVADNAKYGFVELAVVQKYGCIHNGKITLIGESNIFYDYTNNSTIVIKNVDLSGSIEVAGKMGPHYGVLCSYLGNTTNNFSLLSEMYIENVNSWVNIKANSTCVGGLLGYCLNSKVSIKNVNVYSNIETGYGAGGIVMSDSQVTSNYIEASNILFHGNILVPEGKSAFYYGNKRPSSNTDNTYAGETATLVKGINIDNDIVVADNGEFKINANSVYTKYVIRYSFSVDFLDDHAGGYPRVIEKEFSNDANQVISTGIYKNKVKEGTFNSNTDTYVTDGSNGIFTRTGESGTYFYDGVGTYKLSKYGVTVTVYAYSGENLKAVGSYSYPKD